MKYFIDFEFIEGFRKPLFGKRHHFIDMISVGIVAEDGRTFFAISNEYRYKEASQWVKDNVIMPLYKKTVYGGARMFSEPETFHRHYGKSTKEIAREIDLFINPPYLDNLANAVTVGTGVQEFNDRNLKRFTNCDGTSVWRSQPEFYGYYCDYDWVLFCSLFGTMMDLPKGFPKYCRDVKQMIAEKESELANAKYFLPSTPQRRREEISEAKITSLPYFPKNKDEHCALSDAKHIRDTYYFLSTLSIEKLASGEPGWSINYERYSEYLKKSGK